jgi:uncharacterized protein
VWRFIALLVAGVSVFRAADVSVVHAAAGAAPAAAAPAGPARPEAALVEAVKKGDAAAVRTLIDKHVDVNLPELDGTTALHWAAYRGDLALLDRLIAAGAVVQARNRYGITPLSLACEYGQAAVAARLLAAGADANSAVADGETALMTAARAGNPSVVASLLDHGANVNVKEARMGQTALMWAANENNVDAARLLVRRGADVGVRSRGGFTPLLFAVRAGHLGIVSMLLESGADVNETLPDGTDALALAVTNAHFELAASLLDRGANPTADKQGWTPLHQLVWTRRPNAGLADPPPTPTGSLSSLQLARKLLAAGANPNALMKKERKLGFDDRNLFNRIDATPFLIAAQTADVEMMRLLAANGADPKLTNSDGTTALMAAAGVGIWVVGENPGTNEEALEAVKLALDLGGDVNAVNAFGYTALHGAAHRGAPAIVQLLVDRGARLDRALTKTGGGPLGWKEGWTPLAIADGVFYANTFKRSPETADLLRRLMQERGLSVEVRK